MEWSEIDWVSLRTYRWERVRAIMEEQELDHLVLMGFDNIRYVTDYRTQIIAEATDWCAAVVDRSGATDIFVPWVPGARPAEHSGGSPAAIVDARCTSRGVLGPRHLQDPRIREAGRS